MSRDCLRTGFILIYFSTKYRYSCEEMLFFMKIIVVCDRLNVFQRVLNMWVLYLALFVNNL